MQEYRFKLAKNIDVGDRLLVCSIWYVVTFAVDRELPGNPVMYRQFMLQVQGAKETENTSLIMVYPAGALVKVKPSRES